MEKNNFFDNTKIIEIYTTKDALKDRVILDLRPILNNCQRLQYQYLNFITANLAKEGYYNFNKKKFNIPSLIDLFIQINNHIRECFKSKREYEEFYSLYIETPKGKKENIFVVLNELESFTIMKAEDY